LSTSGPWPVIHGAARAANTTIDSSTAPVSPRRVRPTARTSELRRGAIGADGGAADVDVTGAPYPNLMRGSTSAYTTSMATLMKT
jgi:hypothetical protein